MRHETKAYKNVAFTEAIRIAQSEEKNDKAMTLFISIWLTFALRRFCNGWRSHDMSTLRRPVRDT